MGPVGANNLMGLALIVLGNRLLRIFGVPLGFVGLFYNLILYGLFLGTNSFAVPYAERLAPPLAILNRAGPYEMLALILAAAATARWGAFEVRGDTVRRVVGERGARRSDWLWLGIGIVLLGAAAWRKAMLLVVR